MASIVVWPPAENLDSDLLLAERATGILKTPLPQIQKQVAETLGFLKRIAGGYSLQQLP